MTRCAAPGYIAGRSKIAFKFPIRHAVYDGLSSFFKMGADLLKQNWESARENGAKSLEFLLGMKLGETPKAWSALKLSVKEMAFSAQRLAQGVISKSPLEFLKKGPDGREFIFKREQVRDPANPTVPPTEVTRITTPESLIQEVAGNLVRTGEDSVTSIRNFCFAAGTLVHTKQGLIPIEQIKVGDWVLSKHESGAGEQAYKRVTKTIRSENVGIELLRYTTSTSDRVEHLFVTGNHPFYIKDVGWRPAVSAIHPLELVSYDGTPVLAEDSRTLWETTTKGVASLQSESGYIVDFRDRSARVLRDMYDLDEMTGDLWLHTVYNIEVEDYHTYYVGESGVWVHNTNCGGTGDVGIVLRPTLLEPLRPSSGG